MITLSTLKIYEAYKNYERKVRVKDKVFCIFLVYFQMTTGSPFIVKINAKIGNFGKGLNSPIIDYGKTIIIYACVI